MKSTITTSVLERGILTSVYKQKIKQSIRKSKSLSKVKSLLLNHHGKIESQAGTILRVSLFAVVIILVYL